METLRVSLFTVMLVLQFVHLTALSSVSPYRGISREREIEREKERKREREKINKMIIVGKVDHTMILILNSL